MSHSHTIQPDQDRQSRRRGAALLEAVIILPVLLIVVFASIEFGYAFYVKHTLQGAARAGVRAGIVPDSDNSDITSAVTQAMARSGMDEHTFTVEVLDGTDGSAVSVDSLGEGDTVVVKISAPWSQYSVLSGPFGGFMSGSLTGTAIMRREG